MAQMELGGQEVALPPPLRWQVAEVAEGMGVDQVLATSLYLKH